VTGIEETSDSQGNVAVYPNPVTGIVTVDTQMDQPIYHILDITGKMMLQGSVSSAKFNVDITELGSGVYFLQVIDTNGTVRTSRLVKE
jgi:hypothetical protein